MKKNVVTLFCRACGQDEEYLLSACPALTPTVYLYRHNLMAQVLHWHLSQLYSLPLSSRSWYTHKPSENSGAKLLWDFGIVTEGHVLSNRPDIVLYDYGHSTIKCFEVSCSADINVIAKESEKGRKYLSELRSLHPGMSIKVVPVVIGHTSVISLQSKLLLNKILGFCDSLYHHLQKATAGEVN